GVTLSDYVALAQQAGGVAKVRAVSSGWNRIDLYVAPQGNSGSAAPLALKQKLVAFFNDKRMVGTFVTIKDPVPMPIAINLFVYVEHNHNPDFVREAVRTALTNLFSFDNMDFAATLYLSKVYEAVEQIQGVSAANVSRFQRVGGLVSAPLLPPDGRLIAGEFEIP